MVLKGTSCHATDQCFYVCAHFFFKSHAPTCTCIFTFLLMISRYSTSLQMAVVHQPRSVPACQQIRSQNVQKVVLGNVCGGRKLFHHICETSGRHSIVLVRNTECDCLQKNSTGLK